MNFIEPYKLNVHPTNLECVDDEDDVIVIIAEEFGETIITFR